MPEIAEVETVRNTLKLRILKKKIKQIKIHYKPIVMDDEKTVNQTLKGQTIEDIKRIGKWLLFEHYIMIETEIFI